MTLFFRVVAIVPQYSWEQILAYQLVNDYPMGICLNFCVHYNICWYYSGWFALILMQRMFVIRDIYFVGDLLFHSAGTHSECYPPKNTTSGCWSYDLNLSSVNTGDEVFDGVLYFHILSWDNKEVQLYLAIPVLFWYWPHQCQTVWTHKQNATNTDFTPCPWCQTMATDART